MATFYARPELHTYLDAPLDVYHHSIVETLLDRFCLGPGVRVLEVGAGSGRYTAALLKRGLRVVAVEPDPVLCRKLRDQLAGARDARIVEGPIGATEGREPLDLVCGFHVLHHFDEAALLALAASIRRASDGNPGFRGWFFMEPNPWNPLYPLQVALWPGMRFREERGIWRTDYDRIFASVGVRFSVLGHIGALPPPLCRLLPQRWLLQLAPRLRKGPSLALYRVVGDAERRANASASL